MHAILRTLIRIMIIVGALLAFIYFKLGFRATGQTEFDRLNAERREINMQYEKQPPPHTRTDM